MEKDFGFHRFAYKESTNFEKEICFSRKVVISQISTFLNIPKGQTFFRQFLECFREERKVSVGKCIVLVLTHSL